MSELTTKEVDALEGLAKEAQRHTRGVNVGVHVRPETLLSLIAAARELSAVRAALVDSMPEHKGQSTAWLAGRASSILGDHRKLSEAIRVALLNLPEEPTNVR